MSVNGYITGFAKRSSATIDIRRKGNPDTTIVTVPITPRSVHRVTLMNEDYIQLEFSLVEPINFIIGDYFNDTLFGRYVITEEQMAKYNARTGGYDYSLRFNADYLVLGNMLHTMAIIKTSVGNAIVESTETESTYTHPENNSVVRVSTATSTSGVFERMEASWSLTDKLQVHAEQILMNIKAIYYNLDYIVKIHPSAVNAAEMKCIPYDGIKIIEAMDRMAEEYSCEWWITREYVTEGGSTHLRNTIHFGKCELDNTPFQFVNGDNVESMDVSRDQQTFANRIYAYGGTRNIPSSYRKDLVFEVTEVSNGTYRDSRRDITLDMIAGVVTHEDVVFSKQNDVIDTTSGKSITMRWISQTFSLKTGDKISGKLNVSAIANLSTGLTATFSVTRKRQANVLKTYYNETISMPSPSFSNELDIDEKLTAQADANYIEVILTISSTSSRLNISSYAIDSLLELFHNNISAGLGLKFNGTTYNITFNADEYANESTEARYFSFDNGVPSGFGVGSKYTLTGLDELRVPNSYYTPKYEAGVLRKIGDRRLCIPESANGGKQYVQAQGVDHYTKVVENIVVFDDIYPKMSLKVVSVESEVKTIDGKERVIYSFTAKKADNSAFTFNTRYIMDGEKLQAVFTASTAALSSGFMMSGMTFDVGFDNRTQKFTIVSNDDYGVQLPNAMIYPSPNDTFFLTGWNPNAMSALSLIADAESELLAKAQEYLDAIRDGQFAFTCKMMSDIFWLAAYGGQDNPKTYGLLKLGAQVTINNDAMPGGSKTSRIIGYEYKLDIPYDTPTYIVGETEAYSRLKQLEKQITKLS